MAEGTSQPAGLPGFVRALRWILFALLFASAAGALLVLPALDRGAGRPPAVAISAVAALLAVFVVGYGAYRFALVRAGRYSAGKTFVQLGLMLAILGVVLGLSMERARDAGPAGPVDLRRPLASSDPVARALAAELARHREPGEAIGYVPRLVELLGDDSPEVRRQARASLTALAGADAGGAGPDAARRWREYWRDRGVPGL